MIQIYVFFTVFSITGYYIYNIFWLEWCGFISGSAHFLSFFKKVLSCMNCLYILEIDPLLVSSFANAFSHSVSFFHFVNGFFCCAKLLSLTMSPLLIFSFLSLALGDWSKKILLQLMSEDVLPKLRGQSLKPVLSRAWS